MRIALALLCLSLAACKKDPPPPSAPPPAPAAPAAAPATKVPTEVKAEGAVHGVQCQNVVAEWLGDAKGVNGLRFRIDGKPVEFQSAGTLEAADWKYDIFSPDCARVALLQDVLGPVHVVKLANLSAYLAGGGVEAIIQKDGEKGASMVHGDVRWVSNDRLELSAACCGGVEVFQVNVATPKTLERTFFAAQAPKGIRHAPDGGWETVP
jgi:hypothetical protein